MIDRDELRRRIESPPFFTVGRIRDADLRVWERHQFEPWHSGILGDVVACKGCGHLAEDGDCPDYVDLAARYGMEGQP